MPPKKAKVSQHLRKGNWSIEEDERLTHAVANIQRAGNKNWKAVAALVQTRTHVQCLQRWAKALDPDVEKGKRGESLFVRLLTSVRHR
jgi:hypothetical protein